MGSFLGDTVYDPSGSKTRGESAEEGILGADPCFRRNDKCGAGIERTLHRSLMDKQEFRNGAQSAESRGSACGTVVKIGHKKRPGTKSAWSSIRGD